MPILRNVVRVFLASPGDLGDERKISKAVVDEFNKTWANHLSYEIELIGWEDTVTQIGRPQAVINRDMETCELFVGVMWKHWGSPPVADGQFTSGFEEEFRTSLSRYEMTGAPNIKLFFKRVDPSLLEDAGPSLDKVIKFKKEIIDSRNVLFEEFSDHNEYAEKLRKAISHYIQTLKVTETKVETRSVVKIDHGVEKIKSEKSGNSLWDGLGEYIDELREKMTVSGLSDEDPIDAVRLRLFGSFLETTSNDRLSLQPHDANIAFRSRGAISYSIAERAELRASGLYHYSNFNVPLWYWLASFSQHSKIQDQLTNYARFSPIEKIRVGAIRALTICEFSLNSKLDSRNNIASEILSSKTAVSIRQEFLTYLRFKGEIADIELIAQELERKDADTQDLAHWATINILSREDKNSAIKYLLTASLEDVPHGELAELLPSGNLLTEKQSTLAISHRSPAVRSLAVRSMAASGNISALETALEDPSPLVRSEALRQLEVRGRKFTLDEAKSVLGKAGTTFGLLGGADASAEIEKFRKKYLRSLNDLDLKAEIALSSIYEQSAYFEEIGRNYDSRKSELHNLLDNNFDSHEAVVKFMSSDTSLGEYFRSDLLRKALDIVVERGSANDMHVLKKLVSSDNIKLNISDILFLERNIGTSDLDFLISMQHIKKSDSTVNTSLAKLLMKFCKFEVLVDRISDEGVLKAILVSASIQSFKSLGADRLDYLLRHPSDQVRHISVLRTIKDFDSETIASLLNAYITNQQSYFYNVVHWLDFGVSVSRRIVKTVSVRMLGQAG